MSIKSSKRLPALLSTNIFCLLLLAVLWHHKITHHDLNIFDAPGNMVNKSDRSDKDWWRRSLLLSSNYRI
ncbi:hypothetical protein [Nostoc sp. MG11]|uniref:hypothetical protein n=1 Tax=Nostoc sp. MG11 TaxID=2721166 RepID=UPI001D0316A8|nr:hypothetical protein [Nostoc sp. MG11]